MLAHQILRRTLFSALAAFSAAAGCIVAMPLEDYVAASGGQSAVGGSARGGKAGMSAKAGEGGADVVLPGECSTNQDCAKAGAGEPYRCRPSDHTCVALKTDVCPIAYGSAADPNAIFFGAFSTLNPAAPEDNSIVWAHRLALEELSGDGEGGLMGGPGGLRRPLVMVVCDNTAPAVEAGLAHLVETLEVPAVLATLKPGDLRRGFEAHASRDVFYLSPVVSTDTLLNLKDDGLVWHMLGQASDWAPTYAALLPLVEAYEKERRKVSALRVALVTTTAAFDTELANAVVPALTFNGKNTDANAAAGNYAGFTVDIAKPNLPGLATSLVEFRPHVVISTASESFTQSKGLLEEIEVRWDGAIPNPEMVKRPFYVLSPFNAGDLTFLIKQLGEYLEFVTEVNPTHRFVGVSAAGAADITLQNQYAGRLRNRFGKEAYADTGNYYDASYFLAYAMYGAGTEQPLTGSSIASGMLRLLEGQGFTVGPTPIREVQSALDVENATLALEGTLGPPQFDPKTGGRRDEGSVFCFKADGQKVTPVADVLRYDREQSKLVGDFPCFPGFVP